MSKFEQLHIEVRDRDIIRNVDHRPRSQPVANSQRDILARIVNEELETLKRFDLIAGLDGHGYNFPGAIDRFREIGGSTPVLCSASTMDIQADVTNDTRFASINRHEQAFFHSADPASLRAIRMGGSVDLWFKPDARHRVLDDYNDAPRVKEYVVEYATAEVGPWSTFATI